MLVETVASPGLKLLERPARLGHADHGYVEVPVLNQVLDRGKDLLVGQVAGRPEEDEGVGMVLVHGSFFSIVALPPGHELCGAADEERDVAVRAHFATSMVGRRMPSGKSAPEEP